MIDRAPLKPILAEQRIFFGWVVVASTDTSAALAPVRDQQLRTTLLQGVSTLLLIGFAIVLAVLTTRPLVSLSRAAASVKAGDLSARVKDLFLD